MTVEDINNNTPTYSVVNTNRVTASNVNSDDDTNRVTATNSNQITNSNFGRSFGNGWTIVDTSAETCTSTFSVTNYRRNKRKKFSILVWDNLVYLNIQIYKIIFLFSKFNERYELLIIFSTWFDSSRRWGQKKGCTCGHACSLQDVVRHYRRLGFQE